MKTHLSSTVSPNSDIATYSVFVFQSIWHPTWYPVHSLHVSVHVGAVHPGPDSLPAGGHALRPGAQPHDGPHLRAVDLALVKKDNCGYMNPLSRFILMSLTLYIKPPIGSSPEAEF